MNSPFRIALAALALSISACSDDPTDTTDPFSPTETATDPHVVRFSQSSLEPTSVAVNLVMFGGQAYGTSIKAAGGTGDISSGKTAGVALSACEPIDRRGYLASVTESPWLRTSTVRTLADTLVVNGDPAARTTAIVNAVNLFQGLIRASEIKSASLTKVGSYGFRTQGGGSRVEKLTINGNTVAGTANTRIELPGLGYVIVNEQIETIRRSRASLLVRGLHVFVTEENTFGLPVGAEVIVAQAESGLTSGAAAASLEGRAYGSEVRGSTVTSSTTAGAGFGCGGTDGQTVEESVTTAELPGVFAIHAVRSTARGDVSGAGSSSHTTNDILSANVLNGLVQAEGIHAQADATTDGSTVTLDAGGSQFTSLSVEGHPGITASVTGNTRLEIEGLGHMYLKRTMIHRGTIEVRMIEVVVTEENDRGLPVGTRIIVGSAEAGIR